MLYQLQITVCQFIYWITPVWYKIDLQYQCPKVTKCSETFCRGLSGVCSHTSFELGARCSREFISQSWSFTMIQLFAQLKRLITLFRWLDVSNRLLICSRSVSQSWHVRLHLGGLVKSCLCSEGRELKWPNVSNLPFLRCTLSHQWCA